MLFGIILIISIKTVKFTYRLKTRNEWQLLYQHKLINSNILILITDFYQLEVYALSDALERKSCRRDAAGVIWETDWFWFLQLQDCFIIFNT